jgi:hypothetical protein
MKRIFEPGDVNIKRLELVNKTLKASVSPMDQVQGFDIFEDISKPTLYAAVYFNDAIGLLDNFPIIGEEQVFIEFETPGMSTTTTYKFRSFEVCDVNKGLNGKATTFTLRCVSEEHLTNGSSLVTQSYQNIISNIVPDVLQNYLKSKKPIIVDETKGIQTLAVPRLSPLQFIDMCRQRAVSKDMPLSLYFFFENQKGFNFKTLEGLVKEGKKNIGTRIFNAQDTTAGTKETITNSWRTILNFQNIVNMDSNMKAMDGVFKGVSKTFDVATKKFEETPFDFQKVFNKLEKFNNTDQIPGTDAFIKDFGSGVPKNFVSAKNTLVPDTLIDTTLALRGSVLALINSNVTRVMIHGDSGLKVGDMVTLELPAASGLTGKRKEDKTFSGNYLVTRIRHMITPSTKSKHQIVFDCVTMGM